MAYRWLAVQIRLTPFIKMSSSSSGSGHRPFTAKTGVQIPLGMKFYGEVAEWFNAMVLKTIEDTFPPRVQIPVSPIF